MTRQIYIETSVVSYLTSRESSDIIKSACQQITKLWWNNDRLNTISYISPYVIKEVSAGDPQAASERIETLRNIPLLPITPEIPELAEFLLLGGGLPPKAKIDALHIACAAYHELDILLTWNCTHIANPSQLPVIRGLCSAKGYKLPELVTPFELMGVLP
ncbi:type II toxin-antitoxin system VapC family toxin [Cronbergia sp. UHCC 0137]|uniref:type II toxin-antitoxin system VapC family toxin n=1 Tax=Cronbergia sp. UHCC 0137 TaxID=3110239 RepID=UPI002B20112C|nr:type II toxin-antitoxin system VapC family toxin [Cronbergia sp. UHCC 0137]MEA5619301.1 type II toxin-antitoxin system VapC family toxin [Cronbergia sp. UHCC 0137]